ncbi:MAG: hypothetical protein HGA41_00375 [Syntrophaceae bacterium]|nr:hypothetical protein [Syntrophaceae bacterium]
MIGLIADIGSIIGAFAAVLALWQLLKQKMEKKRLSQTVSVVLRCTEDTRQITPLMVVRRKDITRAELQGIIGTIKMREKKSRYDLDYLTKKEFWMNIETLQKSDSEQDRLVIPCSPKEMDQFDPSVLDAANCRSGAEPHEMVK